MNIKREANRNEMQVLRQGHESDGYREPERDKECIEEETKKIVGHWI